MPSNTPTNGNDTFNYVPSSGSVGIDGMAGFDTLNVDYSSANASDYATFDGRAGVVYGNYPFLTYGVRFQNIEAVNFKLGGGDDTVSISGVDSQATVDGGAGVDTFHGLFGAATAAVSIDFSTAGAHTIAGAKTTVLNFENYDIATGAGNDTLIGGDGSDTLNGGAGHNVLYGGGGVDEFDSLNGIDTIFGGLGNDRWSGDYSGVFEGLAFAQGATAGSFMVTGFSDGGATSISGVEYLAFIGGYGSDTVSMHTGSGSISATAGIYYSNVHDVLDLDYSAVGTDQTGSLGSPWYAPLLRTELQSNDASGDAIVADGFDTLHLKLGSGDDAFGIYGSSLRATLDGGAGEDTFHGDFSDATGPVSADFSTTSEHVIAGTGTRISHFETLDVTTGSGNDTLTGGAADDVFHAGDGNDKLNGGGGADALYGGDGSDILFGALGADTIDGGAGADLMNGGGGDDLYFVDNAGDRVVEVAAGGYDTVQTTLSEYIVPANIEVLIYSGVGAFNARGGDGAEDISARNANAAALHGGGGDDTLNGGYGVDSLYGDAGADVIYGGDGADYIRTLTGEGPDTLYGGDGTDLLTIERTDATQNLTVNLSLTTLQPLGEGSYFQSIEQIRVAGGSGADSFTGGRLDDVLKGNGGADTLSGGGGNDVLQGGAGHDSLTGGTGADTFRFDGPVAGSDDTVTDFTSGTDHVALSKAGFGIASLSDFDIVAATSGAFEHKATLVVDTVNHTLSWDADGNGAGAAVLLAHGAFTTAPGDYVLF